MGSLRSACAKPDRVRVERKAKSRLVMAGPLRAFRHWMRKTANDVELPRQRRRHVLRPNLRVELPGRRASQTSTQQGAGCCPRGVRPARSLWLRFATMRGSTTHFHMPSSRRAYRRVSLRSALQQRSWHWPDQPDIRHPLVRTVPVPRPGGRAHNAGITARPASNAKHCSESV